MKLSERTLRRLFRNERTESTLLDPKFMFRCIMCDLTKVNMEWTNLVRLVHRMPETVRTNFEKIISQRTCAIYLFRPKTLTKVKTERTNLVRFVHRMHKIVRTNFEEIISQRTCQIHLIRSKTLVSLSFVRFNESEYGNDELGPVCAPDAQNCANEL